MNALLKEVASASKFTGGCEAPRFISARLGLTNPNPETRSAPKIIPMTIKASAPINPFVFIFPPLYLKFCLFCKLLQ